jgi:hypothetical protein
MLYSPFQDKSHALLVFIMYSAPSVLIDMLVPRETGMGEGHGFLATLKTGTGSNAQHSALLSIRDNRTFPKPKQCYTQDPVHHMSAYTAQCIPLTALCVFQLYSGYICPGIT